MSENKPRRRAQAARAAQKSASRKSGLSRVMLVAMMMVLVAVVSIGGTMAWLQAQSDEIVNTFTTSDITISIKEKETEDGDDSALTNSYQMIPGGTIAKDPSVKVDEDSEDCWLFVELVKSENFDDFMTYKIDATAGWKLVDGQTDVYYQQISGADKKNVDINVLDKTAPVTVLTTVEKSDMAALTAETYPTLKVKAYAVQIANLADANGPITGDTAANAAKAWTLAK